MIRSVRTVLKTSLKENTVEYRLIVPTIKKHITKLKNMIENKQKATLVINYIKKNYFQIIEEIIEQNLKKIKIPILSKKEYSLEEQLKIINIQKKIEIIKITSEEG
uniref:hypothetical protein n=1 Tax=Thecamoeba quadrilineata TaxID=343530 RepID=UPI00226C963A|nr:hypothetical protein OYV93_mgp39 [Thecamoeba quadrilineata]UZN43823.1 hypothetical protein [Thecamoeba quadrilineata]|eukprot:TRINITY_DN14909_c0_g1_i1.p2 TRINITY_DN14909_c0_g1~~TRINITY_DN14909_c0_g1_i1.p2  ORF type:complete len:106 (-),score=2.09 TRINITY_DN14909_c0_g1_i1:432-749(-)